MWNAFGTPEELAAKDAILRAHCEAVGRDESAIERSVGCKVTIRSTEAEARAVVDAALDHNKTPRHQADTDHTFWTGTPEQVAETMLAYKRIGFGTFIVELPAPYDHETMETLVRVVKPMVDAGLTGGSGQAGDAWSPRHATDRPMSGWADLLNGRDGRSIDELGTRRAAGLTARAGHAARDGPAPSAACHVHGRP